MWKLSGVAGAVLGGLLLRLLWAAFVPVQPVSDSVVYDQFAQSLVDGKGFAFAAGNLTAFWAVGTSAAYAVLYSIFGNNFDVIVGFNLMLGVAIIGLTYLVAKRHVSEGAARVAAWLVACWPLQIQFTTVLASELLFTALLLATLFVWGSRALPVLPRSIGWGALLCAAIYVRPTAYPLLVLLPLVQLWSLRSWREPALSLLIAGLTAAALLAPWVKRNHDVFGEFVLVSTNFGVNLWMGNNPASSGGYMEVPERGVENEAHRDALLKKEAIAFIAANPVRYLELSARRAATTYSRESIGVAWNEPGLTRAGGTGVLLPLKLWANVYWWALVLVCLYSLRYVVSRRSLDLGNPLLVVSAFFFTVPILTVGQDRYHMPLVPFVAIFAAWGIEHWRSSRHRLNPPRPSPSRV
jgi:hypothetical protein